jgi:hypothetical protein
MENRLRLLIAEGRWEGLRENDLYDTMFGRDNNWSSRGMKTNDFRYALEDLEIPSLKSEEIKVRRFQK